MTDHPENRDNGSESAANTEPFRPPFAPPSAPNAASGASDEGQRRPHYAPPIPGSATQGAPPFGAGPAYATAPTEQYPPQPNGKPGYQPPESVPSSPKPVKRGAAVGLIAALAVGALVGGVSGGAAGFLVGSNQTNQTSNSSNGPANITVNDASDATTITAVAAAAGPSVVTIAVANGSGAGGTGSGVILSDDGYVLTNAHVVTLDGAPGDASVSVQASDGKLYQAEIVGADPISDLAVIKIQNGGDFQPAEFADSAKLNVGDTAVAIGAPLGLANTVTNGIVSSLNRSITVASSAVPDTEDAPEDNQQGDPFDFYFDTPNEDTAPTASATIALSVIQTDAAINPGNSGGALLDDEGKVIGINVAIASAGQGSSESAAGSIGVGFAIPSNFAQRVAKEIIETGTATHGLLGASVGDVTSTTASTVGAVIQEVTPGGAAAEAGLQAGDVVTAINDLPVTGKTDLTAQVRALAAGSEATITYQRGGQSDEVDVTLGSLG